MCGRRNHVLWPVIFFVVILGSVQQVQACGICVSAIEDALLPPIYLWTLISILIYLLQSVIIPHRQVNIKTVPALPWAILVVFGFFIIGAASTGVGMPILLLVPVLVLVVKSWIPRWHQSWPQNFIRRQRWFSMLVMIVIGCMTLHSIGIHQTRTKVDLVLKWPSASLSSQLMKKMGEQGTAGMNELREIARRGSVYKAAEALTILTENMPSPMDMPLALESLRRAYPPQFPKTEADPWLTQELERAMRKMSGLNLPIGSSPDEWEKQWKEKSGDAAFKARSRF